MIGFHLAKNLSAIGHKVLGIDNFNDYYELSLKRARENILSKEYSVEVIEGDIVQYDISNLLDNIDIVIHLAAYANPRHSLSFPYFYINSNITGTQALIDSICKSNVKQVVYASSSCVMHGQPLPWNEDDRPSQQNNPYGWSKHVNECQFMHSKIDRTVGLRFFTVYGPYGRPDMALFGFTNNILNNKPITLYNYGDMKRDFTYVEDIIDGIKIVMNKCNVDQDKKYHEIYNIGCGQQIPLLHFVDCIENELNLKAIRNLAPYHPADTPATWADISKIKKLGYSPKTNIEQGVKKFINWYKEYYNVE